MYSSSFIGKLLEAFHSKLVTEAYPVLIFLSNTVLDILANGKCIREKKLNSQEFKNKQDFITIK